MPQRSTRYPRPKIERISLKDWLKGINTANDDARTPVDGLKGAGNVVLDQDGTLRPRPSRTRYGVQPTGTILGEIYEFVESTTTGATNWEICMQNVAGTTRPYIRKDGEAWVATTGKTYDNSARAHFVQIDDKVLVMNGTDNLSYFDISTSTTTQTIVPFTSLSTPGAPTATMTGSTAATYTYYYRVSANSTVGETAASTAGSDTSGKPRETWISGTDYMTVTWSSVPSATSYNVYMGEVSGQEFLIAAGVSGTSFIDTGSATYPKDVSRIAPISDSTAGPKVTRGAVINGQVFLTGDKDHPRYVWFGGTTDDAKINFSPFAGGGNVEIGKGTKEFPVKVMAFRDGRGNPQITVLCRGTNGKGKRYLLAPSSVTVGDITIDFMGVTEDNGQDGTDSPDGVILYNDSLWYPSRDGFKTTGTKPQLQNLLSTNRISNTIQDAIKNLNTTAMGMCVGLGFEGKLHWALPNGSDTNNEIWVMDLDRKGAWMKPWSIPADWMWLYNDNDGVTHFCVLVDNEIFELSYSQATNDDGTAFSTNATSGIIKFSEDGMEWAKVIDVTFVLLRPQGNITLRVTGKTEDSALETIGSETYNPETSISGWGETGWDEYLGWADSDIVPTSYGDARAAVVIEVDEILNWWKWDLSTVDIGVDYQLSDVIIQFVRVGVLNTN
jgi:hypothetical protein